MSARVSIGRGGLNDVLAAKHPSSRRVEGLPIKSWI